MSLIERIASYDNLYHAFKECSRGKRNKDGFRRYLPRHSENIKSLELEISKTKNYSWGDYREFWVYDPKKRLVMAAPFKDRIVHTAIYRVTEPIIDKTLGSRTFACRHGMGNKKAAQRLSKQLQLMGKNRYCIKLDAKKYFESINHENLFKKMMAKLPDDSLRHILASLIVSHPNYRAKKRGIPIGNLTSQLFANFYLSEVDQLGCRELQLDLNEDKFESHAGYLRYMDDIVILSRSKEKSIQVANQLVEYAEGELGLSIPSDKYIMLAHDPVPFLGYVHDEKGYRILGRNERRYVKKLKRMTAQGKSLSQKAMVIQSFEAWRNLF